MYFDLMNRDTIFLRNYIWMVIFPWRTKIFMCLLQTEVMLSKDNLKTCARATKLLFMWCSFPSKRRYDSGLCINRCTSFYCIVWEYNFFTNSCFCNVDETIHLLLTSPFAHLIWRMVRMTFGSSPPTNVKNMFWTWSYEINKKNEAHIWVGIVCFSLVYPARL